MAKITKRLINLDAAAGSDNPSSIHSAGVRTAQTLSEARQTVARVLNAHSDEIIFTSGGTEANNLAIFGLARHRVSNKMCDTRCLTFHIITTKIEHASILESCRQLEHEGFSVTYLLVKSDGLIDLKELAQALRPETILVSIGYANNEIGVIQPLREIAKIIRRRCVFHTDACQAPPFLDLNAARLGVDLMTINSSKVGGPKGSGCLYARRGINLQPILYGGGQERGRRSGTENVSAAANFAQALEKCTRSREKESARLAKLRDYFIKKLLALPGTTLNGSATNRLPNNVNVSFAEADSEFMVLNLDARGVLAASGSACSAQEKPASHVITALGHDATYAQTAVRFTLSRETKKADLDYVLKILPEILKRARIA